MSPPCARVRQKEHDQITRATCKFPSDLDAAILQCRDCRARCWDSSANRSVNTRQLATAAVHRESKAGVIVSCVPLGTGWGRLHWPRSMVCILPSRNNTRFGYPRLPQFRQCTSHGWDEVRLVEPLVVASLAGANRPKCPSVFTLISTSKVRKAEPIFPPGQCALPKKGHSPGPCCNSTGNVHRQRMEKRGRREHIGSISVSIRGGATNFGPVVEMDTPAGHQAGAGGHTSEQPRGNSRYSTSSNGAFLFPCAQPESGSTQSRPLGGQSPRFTGMIKLWLHALGSSSVPYCSSPGGDTFLYLYRHPGYCRTSRPEMLLLASACFVALPVRLGDRSRRACPCQDTLARGSGRPRHHFRVT